MGVMSDYYGNSLGTVRVQSLTLNQVAPDYYLQRHSPVQLGIADTIHPVHTTFAQQLNNPVVSQLRS